jgi:hypothetical protein
MTHIVFQNQGFGRGGAESERGSWRLSEGLDAQTERTCAMQQSGQKVSEVISLFKS